MRKSENHSTFNWKHLAIFSMLTVSVCLNIRSNLLPSSRFALLKEVLIDKNDTRVFFGVGMDRFLDRVAPEGNVMLRFQGFPTPKRERDRATALLTYWRATYHLYPRKVFVVPENVVVNTGMDIAEHPFHPTRKWLLYHGVTKIITLTCDSRGAVHSQVEALRPRRPATRAFEEGVRR